jgi:hypothetical protein
MRTSVAPSESNLIVSFVKVLANIKRMIEKTVNTLTFSHPRKTIPNSLFGGEMLSSVKSFLFPTSRSSPNVLTNYRVRNYVFRNRRK